MGRSKRGVNNSGAGQSRTNETGTGPLLTPYAGETSFSSREEYEKSRYAHIGRFGGSDYVSFGNDWGRSKGDTQSITWRSTGEITSQLSDGSYKVLGFVGDYENADTALDSHDKLGVVAGRRPLSWAEQRVEKHAKRHTREELANEARIDAEALASYEEHQRDVASGTYDRLDGLYAAADEEQADARALSGGVDREIEMGDLGDADETEVVFDRDPESYIDIDMSKATEAEVLAAMDSGRPVTLHHGEGVDLEAIADAILASTPQEPVAGHDAESSQVWINAGAMEDARSKEDEERDMIHAMMESGPGSSWDGEIDLDELEEDETEEAPTSVSKSVRDMLLNTEGDDYSEFTPAARKAAAQNSDAQTKPKTVAEFIKAAGSLDEHLKRMKNDPEYKAEYNAVLAQTMASKSINLGG